jgi:hypothetical protein
MDNLFLAERLQGEEAAGASTTSSRAAAARCERGTPQRTAEAHTVSWAAQAHFLLVRLSGSSARVVPIGEDGRPLVARAPDGTNFTALTTIERPAEVPVTSDRAATPSE